MATLQNYAYLRSSSAEALDWSRIKFFTPNEFPLDQLKFLNKYVIEELDVVRDTLRTPIIVSPAEGAVVRFNEDEKGQPKSWHDSAEKRKLGQAIDVFLPSSGDLSVVETVVRIFAVSRVRGLGIYFDTQLGRESCVMLHLDLRHDPLLWYCPNQEKRKYIYMHSTRTFFTDLEKQWDDFHWQKKLNRPEERAKSVTPLS